MMLMMFLTIMIDRNLFLDDYIIYIQSDLF